MSQEFRVSSFLMFSNQTCSCRLFHFSGENFYFTFPFQLHRKCLVISPGVDKNRFPRKDVGDMRRRRPRTRFSLDNRVERAVEPETVCASLLLTFFQMENW